jgi:ribosomal protein S18 acetylase RimI-like enzyme
MTADDQPTTSPIDQEHRGAAADTVTVRRATPADADSVQTLMLELADHEGFAHAVRTTRQDWTRMLAHDGVVVLLALRGDRPVGYVSAVRQLHLWSAGEILAMDDLYARPEARGAGVGTRLMSALAQHAAADGQLSVRWEMEVDNEGAQRFYRRLGAVLRTKVIASWQPHDYQTHVEPGQDAVGVEG